MIINIIKTIMPTEKTVTRETQTEVKNPTPVRETKTTTKTETREEPRKVREETTVVEEED